MRARRDRVDVWHVALDAPQDPDMAVLSATELARAARFATATLRRRFIASREALRRILARYADADPTALDFASGPWGKPVLVAPAAAASLSFNLSHSADRMVCAVTAERRVGIDIEQARPDVDVVALAHRYFSAKEIAALMRLDAADRRRGFFAGWTRKEAFIKAIGKGLSMPLGAFSVSLDSDAAVLLDVEGEPDEAARWTMESVEPGSEFMGALVVEGDGWTAAHRHWPEDEPALDAA